MPRKRLPRVCLRCPNLAEWKSRHCGPCRAQREVEAREARRLASAAYRRRHPDRVRVQNRRTHARPRYLQRQYGVTTQQFDAMTAEQGGRCAICQRTQDPLHVDHDHGTGRVRGLLCGACNRGIGIFGEDASRLEAALDYLSRHKGRETA